jgi:hypothetical protein
VRRARLHPGGHRGLAIQLAQVIPRVIKPSPRRIDRALQAAVARLAAQDFRSVNAEVEVLLREALERRGVKVPAPDPPKRGRPPKKD